MVWRTRAARLTGLAAVAMVVAVVFAGGLRAPHGALASTGIPNTSPTLGVAANIDPTGGNGVDTGLDVAANQEFAILADATTRGTYGNEGQAGCIGLPFTDAAGNRFVNGTPCSPSQKIDGNATLGTAPIGSLLYRIGASGAWHLAGLTVVATAVSGGRIYLAYNDDPGQYGNDQGGFSVSVETNSLSSVFVQANRPPPASQP